MSSTYCIILRKQRKVHTVLFRKCIEENFKKYKIKKERWMFLTKLNDLRAVGVVGREACARWVCSPVLHPQFPPKNIIQWPPPPKCSIFYIEVHFTSITFSSWWQSVRQKHLEEDILTDSQRQGHSPQSKGGRHRNRIAQFIANGGGEGGGGSGPSHLGKGF